MACFKTYTVKYFDVKGALWSQSVVANNQKEALERVSNGAKTQKVKKRNDDLKGVLQYKSVSKPTKLCFR